jgi:hypothetical protein
MFFSKIAVGALLAVAQVRAVNLETDITKISRSWGQVSVYADNEEDYFGVEYVGLPDGCQIVSRLYSVVCAHQLTCPGICQHSSTTCPTFPDQRR